MKTLKPNWIAEKKVNFPVQLNLTRGAELQDVPLVTEFAKNDKQSVQQVLGDATIVRFAQTVVGS